MKPALAILIFLSPAVAWAAEPELLADVPAARAAGFEIVDMRNRPSDERSDLVRTLVDDYARARGVTRSVSADWAPIRLPGGEVLLAVWPLGAEFDVPGAAGGRLIVYAVRNDAAADLLLETSAMSVAVKGGEIAAIQETGFWRFVWDGAKLQRRP